MEVPVQVAACMGSYVVRKFSTTLSYRFLGEPSQSIAWTAPPSHMAAAIPRSWVPRSDPADSEPDFGGGEGYLILFYNQVTLLFVAFAAISYLLLSQILGRS